MRVFAAIIISIISLASITALLGLATTAIKSKVEGHAEVSSIEFVAAPNQPSIRQQCESLTQQVNEELFNHFNEYKRCAANEECGLFVYSDFKCPLVIRKEKVQALKGVLDTQLAKSFVQHAVKDGCVVSEFQCKEYRCVATTTSSGRGFPPPPSKLTLPVRPAKNEL